MLAVSDSPSKVPTDRKQEVQDLGLFAAELFSELAALRRAELSGLPSSSQFISEFAQKDVKFSPLLLFDN